MQALLDRLDLLSRVEQRYEEALSLATTLEVVIARNGHPSAEALQLHVRVGSAQLGLGHYDEARAEYVAAQARLDETSQLEVRATIHNNLGAVDFSQGRFPRARQQFELALELRAGFQGELHTDYATGLLNVGNVLLTTGDIDGGIERYAHALAIFDAIDDADTPEAAGVHNSLAVAYYSKGRFDLAREQAQRALDAYDAHLGADAPARAGPAIMLAQLDALDGETDRARTRLSDLVDAMTRALGSNHPNTALPTAGLGRLEREAGDLGAARPHLERALELLHPLGDAHPWLLAVSTDLALLELAEGHRTEAQRHAERALRIGDAGQEDRQELGRALYAAAMVHRDTDLDAAGRYARRGLDTLRANGGRPAWILAQLQEIVRAAGADGAIDDE
jgi:tetratricopeptide (TPR) repeat protein